jgi:hypothetical protein
MSFTAEELWKLLPAVHRLRDAELGAGIARRYGLPELDAEKLGPLRQLIEVIAGQVAVVDESLEELYENQFVETAAPWALPYLGELLGIRGLTGSGAAALAPRAEVGHTIGYRRRKGTVAMLEQLARDATGWPASAVEFFERLAATQHLNHLRPHIAGFATLRNADALEFFDSAFEKAARTMEARRIQPGRGKWNIPNVGIFLWRLRAQSLTQSPLAPSHLPGGRHYRFHPLGLDAPLFTLPQTEAEIAHLATPLNVPLPITRRMLTGDPETTLANQFHPDADYYGPGLSVQLHWKPESEPNSEIGGDEILVADLSDRLDNANNVIGWSHDSIAGLSDQFVLLDPILGRVVFPKPTNPDGDLLKDVPPLATFHYGFSADLGSGEYDRSRTLTNIEGLVLTVAAPTAVDPRPISTQLAALAARPGVIEITESERFPETLAALDVGGRQLEIRAVDGCRPLVILSNPLDVTGDDASALTLNGLLLADKRIAVTGPLRHLRLRHCSFIAGLSADTRGHVQRAAGETLRLNAAETELELTDCIVGPIRVHPDVRVRLRNCIVDAGGVGNLALGPLNNADAPAGHWRIENCTVLGAARLGTLELGSNCIFLGALEVERRQEGCVRFSWLPPGARTPRRYECLPREAGPDLRPEFTSLRSGDPAYAQLSRFCPEAIRRGADDESEQGAFHDLRQPQREAHLRARLPEYLRLGLEAGVFFAT